VGTFLYSKIIFPQLIMKMSCQKNRGRLWEATGNFERLPQKIYATHRHVHTLCLPIKGMLLARIIMDFV
jgi:hypothetical protein